MQHTVVPCPLPRAYGPGVILSQTSIVFCGRTGISAAARSCRITCSVAARAPFCAWQRRPRISTMSQQASPWQALTASLSGLGQALAELPRHTSRTADSIGAAVQDGRRDLAAKFMSRRALFCVSDKTAIRLHSYRYVVRSMCSVLANA